MYYPIREKMEDNDIRSFYCQDCALICLTDGKYHIKVIHLRNVMSIMIDNYRIPRYELRMKFKLSLQDNQDHLAVELSGEDAVSLAIIL